MRTKLGQCDLKIHLVTGRYETGCVCWKHVMCMWLSSSLLFRYFTQKWSENVCILSFIAWFYAQDARGETKRRKGERGWLRRRRGDRDQLQLNRHYKEKSHCFHAHNLSEKLHIIHELSSLVRSESIQFSVAASGFISSFTSVSQLQVCLCSTSVLHQGTCSLVDWV